MKQIVLFFLMITFSISVSAQVAFTAGNLAIYRVGDGASALINTGNSVFIDEYTTAGVLVRSIALPTAPAGAQGSLVSAGSSTSEGLLTRSSDGTVLLATGYNATLPNAVNLTSSTSATINRSVGVIKADGTVDITTKLTDFASGNNPRSAVSNNSGANLWVGGGAGGVRYATLAATTSTQLNATSPGVANIRQVNIFNGNLYYSTSSTTPGIFQVGTGLPTTAQATTLIVATGVGSGPYAFAFNGAGDVLYIADDRAIAAGGGIQKWTLSGGVWTLAYTLGTGAASTVGARGLTVDFTGTNRILYATTADAPPNRLITVTDAGAGSVATTLVTATVGTNPTAFRGVAFAPQAAVVPVRFISFVSSTTDNGIALKWVTANEQEIAAFTVQKSTDGRVFEDIRNVAARNNTIGSEYNFTYSDKVNAAIYFRIKATEMSGRLFYTDILKAGVTKAGTLNVYPTVTSGSVTIRYDKVNAQGNLIIVSMTGKEMFRKAVSPNVIAESISVQEFPAGSYIIKYSTNTGSIETGRFVKQ